MKESKFEREFCTWLRRRGCIVLKNCHADKGRQDRTVLMPGGGWALLEFKKSEDAPFQTLQEEKIRIADEMWYSRAVYPENAEQIKKELLCFI